MSSLSEDLPPAQASAALVRAIGATSSVYLTCAERLVANNPCALHYDLAVRDAFDNE
jgi:hypothetical protein